MNQTKIVMKRNIVTFAITTGLLWMITACQNKNNSSHVLPSAQKSAGISINNVYTIQETNQAVLHVRSELGSIYIDNQKPGSALGSNQHYRVTDFYGKSFDIDPQAKFAARTQTGLFGPATIYKNGKQIFKETYNKDKADFACGTLDSYPPTSRNNILTKGIGASKYYWPNGSIIKVKFWKNTGPISTQQKVMRWAHEWEKYANIKFKLVSPTEYADIRVDLTLDDNSYTTGYTPGGGIGKNILTISEDEYNMHLGSFYSWASDRSIGRTVLHEFGHALGLAHEHRHPNAPINESKYINYLIAEQGWTRADATHQASIFNATHAAIWDLKYTDYDDASIMHYSVPADCTTTRVALLNNYVLSDGDKAFIGLAYPFPPNVIYTINNDSGIAQIDVLRNVHDGNITIINKHPGTSLNSNNQTYVFLLRSQNGNWYKPVYSFSSNRAFPATTLTGIISFGPTKGQHLLIERRNAGESRGTIIFKE